MIRKKETRTSSYVQGEGEKKRGSTEVRSAIVHVGRKEMVHYLRHENVF